MLSGYTPFMTPAAGIGHEDLRRASHSVPQPRRLGRNLFEHRVARARSAWDFLVRLALYGYVRFSWVLEYILK